MIRSIPVFVVMMLGLPLAAQEPTREQRLRGAVERALPLLHRAATNYTRHRDCFSCHHQTLPLLAAVTAERVGIPSPPEWMTEQREFTRKSFSERLDRLKERRSIGGRSATAAYALWTLELVEHPADEVTTALVHYVLGEQRPDGGWQAPSHRPPLEEARQSLTFLALRGLQRYGTNEQQGDIAAAIRQGERFQAGHESPLLEDLAFGLRGAKSMLDSEQQRRRLADRQRADGGWSATPDLESEAYSTGQALFVLLDGGWPMTAASRDAAVEFLLNTQAEDGSWHVRTRSKPVQEWFDNGDPYDRDQFISIAGTAWATAALARGLPPGKAGNP